MAPLDRDLDDLPPAFLERMVEVLGSRDALAEVLEAETRPALRVNTLLAPGQEVERRFAALGIRLEPVPFCDHAFFYEDPQDRPVGLLWEHQAGHVFSQDAASTLPVLALDPQPGERVLDLAAAPGGKTTHMAQRMENQGLIVANDPNPGRVNNMISNLDRVGAMNVAVTNRDAAGLAWPITFDKVLVDAPCTNLGHMHESWRPVYSYSRGRVGQCHGLQKQLLESAFHAVAPGGTIVYSTCTLEPRENEEVVDWFLDAFPVTVAPVELALGPTTPPLVDRLDVRAEVAHAIRVHPGDIGTDGFFVAKFVKNEDVDWPNGRRYDAAPCESEAGPEGAIEQIIDAYGLDAPGLARAKPAHTSNKVYATTVPDVEEALSLRPDRLGLYLARPESEGYRLSFDGATAFGRRAERAIELSPVQARAWLAGQPAPWDEPVPWSVVTCQGEAIGCVRTFGDELPCYVPKQRRVPAEGEMCGFLAP